jgi:hypothetical protein
VFGVLFVEVVQNNHRSFNSLLILFDSRPNTKPPKNIKASAIAKTMKK